MRNLVPPSLAIRYDTALSARRRWNGGSVGFDASAASVSAGAIASSVRRRTETDERTMTETSFRQPRRSISASQSAAPGRYTSNRCVPVRGGMSGREPCPEPCPGSVRIYGRAVSDPCPPETAGTEPVKLDASQTAELVLPQLSRRAALSRRNREPDFLVAGPVPVSARSKLGQFARARHKTGQGGDSKEGA